MSKRYPQMHFPPILKVLSLCSTIIAAPCFAEKLTPLDPTLAVTKDTRYPVELKCPDDNGSVLELILRRKDLRYDRLRANFMLEKITQITIAETKDSGQAFVVYADSRNDTKGHEKIIDWFRTQATALKSVVCATPELLKRFNVIASKNRDILSGALPEN